MIKTRTRQAVAAPARALLATSLGWLVMVVSSLLLPAPAHALLTIEITRGVDAGVPIAVVPFGGSGAAKPPVSVSDVIEADLTRSGRFAPIDRRDFASRPETPESIVFKDWRLLKADALVIGKVIPVSAGRYDVQFRLYDVYKQSQLAGFRYTVNADALRSVAHQIADIIHEKLTGEPGAFNTRIAYITREQLGRVVTYKLQVADSDGYGPRTIMRSNEPLMSPAWSPDGRRLAYVSFEEKRAKVYVQQLADGRRELIAEFKGINSAPAWSPDGRSLALTLSREGDPEIYVLDLSTRALTRLTFDRAIDTEPAWSPDGRKIVFTSDRAGRPQIYRMSASGGQPERLTFEGDYNARPSFAPDGNSLTFVHGTGGQYHIASLKLNGGELQVLTDAPLDESPSFAPNGRMVLYATELRGRGVLASVSADGRVRQVFRSEEGDVREPAWSPYNRQL